MKKTGFNRKRRLFVGGVAATTAALYAAAVGRGALKACGIDELNVGLADLRPLVRIGDAYLDELAGSGELSTLNDKLLDDLRRLRSASRADVVLRQFLAVGRQAQEEFQRGETVSCDGWVLASSEARFCAVVAISVRRSRGT